ncbi:E3 ubiquitin-protein ligase RHF1A isoform X2 [Manihot esculenta]|uniref:E3 ubiquitin-protein ligase RHF1A isoform X2 n=1 Tax=Manihot esculenta TaxID=3983 RepID=UPI000B5D6A9C|nr:E3 ubiquitin-protein ligase RHF1A isoform X2 [Manihot esculenta]
MAICTSSSTSFSSYDNPIISAPADGSSSGAAVDDAFEDACSICLEPFSAQDPPTVTSCKHEYHLQCILEWSQRSKECPICWQLLVLKDPACQELLAAVETERCLRSRNTSSTASINLPHFHEDFDVEQDYYSDDSDSDEHIMQHLAAAASRAHYFRRRERQRSSEQGSSQFLIFNSASNVPSAQQTHSSTEEGQDVYNGSSGGNLPTHLMPSEAVPSVAPPVVNVVSSAAINRDVHSKPRVFTRPSPTDAPQNPSEVLSFSESIKSKWIAASARYKDSFSKSTRVMKEKLCARNNSVKELSKGVQREMSAGIAGVARMIERLDITSKRTGASSPVSDLRPGASDLFSKGKGMQENIITQSFDEKSKEIAHAASMDVSSHVSCTVPGLNIQVF